MKIKNMKAENLKNQQKSWKLKWKKSSPKNRTGRQTARQGRQKKTGRSIQEIHNPAMYVSKRESKEIEKKKLLKKEHKKKFSEFEEHMFSI